MRTWYQAITDANSLSLVTALDGFLQELAPQVQEEVEVSNDAIAINPFILKTVLEVDLEECI